MNRKNYRKFYNFLVGICSTIFERIVVYIVVAELLLYKKLFYFFSFLGLLYRGNPYRHREVLYNRQIYFLIFFPRSCHKYNLSPYYKVQYRRIYLVLYKVNVSKMLKVSLRLVAIFIYVISRELNMILCRGVHAKKA